MRCTDVTELLLSDESGSDAELQLHVAGCARCAYVARGLERLDRVLTATLMVQPPLELQWQLTHLAVEAARPQRVPWWGRLRRSVGELDPVNWLTQRPQMVAAQGLAAVMLALASWQIFGWVSTFQPVIGDVAYAMELVAASPASVYLSGLQPDLQSLGLWGAVGVGGWLIAEDGFLGRTLLNRLRLP